MKETKRSFAWFSFFDRSGIEAYLEKQAQKGWMLEKIATWSWHFRRIEPKAIHFSVVYYPKASMFDPEPSEDQQLLIDFCAHTGWKLAVSDGQIFYNEAEDPTPIETDAALEVSTIHAAAKKIFLSNYYRMVVCGLLSCLLFLLNLVTDPFLAMSSIRLIAGFNGLFVLAAAVVEISAYFCWHHRAKAAAELDGSFTKTPSGRIWNLINGLMFVALLLSWIIALGNWSFEFLLAIAAVIGGIQAIACVSNYMKKKKLSAKRNRAVTVVLAVFLGCAFTAALIVLGLNGNLSSARKSKPVGTYEYQGKTFELYRDELPLTIEELFDPGYDQYSYEIKDREGSLLMEYEEADQRPRWDALSQPRLSYSITTVKAPLLYGWCRDVLLKDVSTLIGRPKPEKNPMAEYAAIDPAPWGAEEAYQLRSDGEMELRFLLCYDRRIVKIAFRGEGWNLTPEQMKLVAKKLG